MTRKEVWSARCAFHVQQASTSPSPPNDAAAAASGRTTPRAAAGLRARVCRHPCRGAPRTAGRLDTAAPCARAGTGAPCRTNVAMALASRRELHFWHFCGYITLMQCASAYGCAHESGGAASGVGAEAGGASSTTGGKSLLPAPLDAVVLTHSRSGSCFKSSLRKPERLLSPGRGKTTTRR